MLRGYGPGAVAAAVYDHRQRCPVKAGAFSPMTAKKVCAPRPSRMRTASQRSTWSILPACSCRLQEDVFPDTDDFGRIFRNNAVNELDRDSANHGHYGHVRRRGAYLPVMTDTVLMTEGSGLFLPAPLWCRRPSDRRPAPEGWAGQPCTPRSPGPLTSRNRTIAYAWRACVPWWGRWANERASSRLQVFEPHGFDLATRRAPGLRPRSCMDCMSPSPGPAMYTTCTR